MSNTQNNDAPDLQRMPWMFKALIFGSVLVAMAVKIVLVTMVGLGATWTNILDWTGSGLGLDQMLPQPQISSWQIRPAWPPCWLWPQQCLKETPRVKTWLHAHCFFASREQYLTPSSMPNFATQSVPTTTSLIWKQQGPAIFGDAKNDILELLKALSADANTLVIGAPDSKSKDHCPWCMDNA